MTILHRSVLPQWNDSHHIRIPRYVAMGILICDLSFIRYKLDYTEIYKQFNFVKSDSP